MKFPHCRHSEALFRFLVDINFIFSDHAMGPIPEEMIAFDNQAYHSLNLDSGFDSSPSSYENVPRSIDSSEEPSYENIDEDLEALSYENIEPPLTYQNKSMEENRLAPSCQFEEYENLKFQKTEIGPLPPPPPLDSTLPQKGLSDTFLKDSPKTVHKAIPVYATCKKTPKITLAETEDEGDEYDEESPVYENYDFQVQNFAKRSNYFPQKLHWFNFHV